jgi:RNA polymerase sigma factor (TIGR02999 family)
LKFLKFVRTTARYFGPQTGIAIPAAGRQRNEPAILFKMVQFEAGQAADVTGLLRAWSAGDRSALDQLAPILHAELKRIAQRCMRRERKEHTLQPTALVNEAFLRLVNVHGIQWQDRAHFFALCAQMMRRILVSHAIARGAGKRGGAARMISLDDVAIGSPEHDSQVVELDQALEELAKLDPRKAQIVEMRFFAGLNFEEIAAVLNVSSKTVLRDWNLSKTWLAREMSRGTAG